jgi:hypothetical protein
VSVFFAFFPEVKSAVPRLRSGVLWSPPMHCGV